MKVDPFRLWISILLAIFPPAVLAQNPPRVAVDFEIDSDLFERHLPNQPLVREEIARELSDKTSDAFSFLGWTPEQSDSRRARLTLRMFEKPVGQRGARGIYLEYIGQVIGDDGQVVSQTRIDIPDYPKREGRPFDCQARPEIYLNFEGLPNHNAERLISDLKCHLHRQFQNDIFRESLLRDFLGQINLVNEFFVDPGSKSLVLPLSWEKLNASDRSILAAKFESVDDKHGQMKFRPVTPHAELVRCLVQFFIFDAISWSEQTPKHWHPDFPRIFSSSNLRSLQIFMEHYEKAGAGRTALDPFSE